MRYFFHISPGRPSDEDGEELVGDDEARSLAHQMALEMVRHHPPRADERIVVIDERGDVVHEELLHEAALSDPDDHRDTSAIAD